MTELQIRTATLRFAPLRFQLELLSDEWVGEATLQVLQDSVLVIVEFVMAFDEEEPNDGDHHTHEANEEQYDSHYDAVGAEPRDRSR